MPTGGPGCSAHAANEAEDNIIQTISPENRFPLCFARPS